MEISLPMHKTEYNRHRYVVVDKNSSSLQKNTNKILKNRFPKFHFITHEPNLLPFDDVY